MLFVPPRHGKSEMVTVRYPVWRLEQHPSERVIIGAYNQILANKFSRKARRIAETRIALAPDRQAVEDWETPSGGGLRAIGVGAGITGQGGHLVIIDDPVKSREEAESDAYRERVWYWYRDDLYTRLEPGGQIILIQCMTGDTPVLMADGTERPLREVKVGDRVATYDNGKLTTSTVRNHKSNGLDSVFVIRTISGRMVHANERHPFLVEEHGQFKWTRLKNLTTGHKIVTVRDSGASGRAKPAPSRVAESQPSAEGTAHRTITRKCGLMGIALRRLIQSLAGMHILSIAMESPPLSMTQCTQRKGANALSASSRRETIPLRIGRASCALTTATRPTRSGGFCATTVTLPLDTPRQRQQHSPWPNISDFTTEAIASIEPAGIEEVFDLQIERTENFIANGLVSHNTRWHEDDLAGRILNSDNAKDWTVVSLPALAEENDPLGREVGEALCPDRYDVKALADIQSVLKSSFYALYQQRPQPPSGNTFKTEWFARRNPIERQNATLVIQAWDTAFKEGQENDRSACITLAAHSTGIYVLDAWRDTVAYPDLIRRMQQKAMQWAPDAILVEDKGSGTSAVQTLRGQTNLPIIAEPTHGRTKVERANQVTAFCEAGRVVFPQTPWADDLLDELIRFPTGAHDDQVDAFVYALHRIAEGMYAASSLEY